MGKCNDSYSSFAVIDNVIQFVSLYHAATHPNPNGFTDVECDAKQVWVLRDESQRMLELVKKR